MTRDVLKEGDTVKAKSGGKLHVIKEKVVGGVVLEDEKGNKSNIGFSGLDLHYELTNLNEPT